MIALVLAMIRQRRGQALVLAALSLVAVAAAVAAPAYLRATDRAVAAGQVAIAAPAERGVVLSAEEDDRATSPDGATPVRFTDIGAALTHLPGFAYVYAAEHPAIGIERDPRFGSRFVYRQDVCAHLVVVSGRCLVGEGEVVVGVQTARRLSLTAGDGIILRAARLSPDPRIPIFLPDGKPQHLTIVGMYRVPDPGAAYWGTHGYFATDLGDRPGEPVFTNAATLAAMDHGQVELSIDGTAGPRALDVDTLPALRSGLIAMRQTAIELGTGVTLETRITDLLDRIDAGRAAARLLVPVVAVPLVLLACLCIVLAVGYGTEGRRPELAVVALRGARWGQRWWLATGENLIAILTGAVAGCVAGQLLVNTIAALRFPGVGAVPAVASLRYAPLAAAAAVVAALLAERRPLLNPVAELLRRTRRLSRGGLVLEASAALLAAVTAAQLVISGGSLAGVGLFAPALVLLALALLAARALLPAVTRYAGRALRRGRVGTALAGFQLARRPGAARLFALLVAAVAMAGYAACAVDVAARGRTVQARLGTGADRVVSVAPVSRSQLLAAVRAIDPQGRYAMAVAALPTATAERPRGLAVDTTRLAATAFWPADAPPPAAVARALRPPAPAPVVLPGQDLAVDLTTAGVPANVQLRLSLVVSSVTGLGDATVQLGTARPGTYTYQQRVPVCRDGCRLKAIGLSPERGGPVTGQITLRALSTVNPARTTVTAERLADASRWRLSGPGRLAAAPGGLRIDVETARDLFVQPVDTPYPLPVATAGTAYADAVEGLDGRTLAVARTVRLPAVPAAGTRATLADLEYADLLSTDSSYARDPQVWLSAAAPPDVLDRLARQGLVVVDDVRAGQVHRQLDKQGPALALWFYLLAGCLATALGAGALILAAVVDRTTRVADLSVLRVQGLDRSAVRHATLWTYPVLAAIAVLAGLAIALIGWEATGWALPLAGLDPPALPMPGQPRAAVLAGVAAVTLVVLATAAFVAGRRTQKEIA